MEIPDGKALWAYERERVNSAGTVAQVPEGWELGDFLRVVCRNRFRLFFFGLDHGLYALEEPVQNSLQSGAGALSL
jgi:hypothetical protein